MPTNYFGNNNWTEAAQVGEGIGNALSQSFLQIPQLRAQKLMLEMERQGLIHDSALKQAQTEFTKTRNEGAKFSLGQQQQASQANAMLGGAVADAMEAFTKGDVSTADAKFKQAMQYVGMLKGIKPEDLVKSATMMQGAMTGDKATGLGQKPTLHNVGANETVMDGSGKVVGSGMISTRPGQTVNIPQIGTNAPATFQGMQVPGKPDATGGIPNGVADAFARAYADETHPHALQNLTNYINALRGFKIQPGQINQPAIPKPQAGGRFKVIGIQ